MFVHDTDPAVLIEFKNMGGTHLIQALLRLCVEGLGLARPFAWNVNWYVATAAEVPATLPQRDPRLQTTRNQYRSIREL